MAKPAFTYRGRPYSFREVILKYDKVRRSLPEELGTIAVNFFKDSWRRQGWRDRGLTPWPDRKNKKGNKGKAILVQSGRMRNAMALGSVSFRKTEIVNDTPYAAAHNEGYQGTVNVRAHKRRKTGSYKVRSTSLSTGRTSSRRQRLQTGSVQVRSHRRKMNLPQRQFMGNSYVMELKLEKHIDNMVMKIF